MWMTNPAHKEEDSVQKVQQWRFDTCCFQRTRFLNNDLFLNQTPLLAVFLPCWICHQCIGLHRMPVEFKIFVLSSLLVPWMLRLGLSNRSIGLSRMLGAESYLLSIALNSREAAGSVSTWKNVQVEWDHPMGNPIVLNERMARMQHRTIWMLTFGCIVADTWLVS